MPHIENVTQIIMRTLEGGRPYGVNYERTTGRNQGIYTWYQKASKKAKPALLDEFTRLTGCHRKSALRLLSHKPVREILLYGSGKAVKLKPERKRPANRRM
jgi:hypothetical protein